jgi:mandelate racemase
VKFKVGYPHVEQDRAVIRAARGAAGKDLQVMVDYNQSPTVPEAIGRIQLLEEEGLVWVEEPTRADDFTDHARIASECRTPIQIGENLWGAGRSDKEPLGGCIRLRDAGRHEDWRDYRLVTRS